MAKKLQLIKVNVEDDEIVQVCLGGLSSQFGAFRIAAYTRENTTSFFMLHSIFLVEKNHAGASTSMHTDGKMLYMEEDRPRARGRRGRSAHNRSDRQEWSKRHNRNAKSGFKPS